MIFFLALLPAWRTLRPELLRDLQSSGRSSAARSLRLAGRLLVLTQITVTVVLIACAGWLIGGVYMLLHQPLGFASGHLLMMEARVDTSSQTKKAAQKAELTFTQMAASVRHLPGVESAALADHVPLGHFTNRYTFCSDVHPEQCGQQANINPNSYAISPGYFSTLGQPLLEGRDFNPADDGRNHVAIVFHALAAREWPGQSALGHRVHTGEIELPEGTTWATVIGVVGKVHTYDLATAPGPDLYIPRTEDPRGFSWIVAKVESNPGALKNSARATLKKEFPQVRASRFQTMAEEMAGEVVERVFLMQVAGAFGGVALFLSILGTYGLLAYEVSLREKEIGIRLALGSSRGRVLTLLLHQEGRWLATGALLGLGCAVVAGYALRSRFYAVHETTLPVLLGSALLLVFPALMAIALPARRAALQDPAESLRRE